MGKTIRHSDTKRKRDLIQLTEFSRSFAKEDPYLHGMANGMILAESIVTGKEPKFEESKGRYNERKFKRAGR